MLCEVYAVRVLYVTGAHIHIEGRHTSTHTAGRANAFTSLSIGLAVGIIHTIAFVYGQHTIDNKFCAYWCFGLGDTSVRMISLVGWLIGVMAKH